MVRSLAAVVVVVEAPLVMTHTATHLLVCPPRVAPVVGQTVFEASAAIAALTWDAAARSGGAE